MKGVIKNPAAWMLLGACAVVVGVVFGGMLRLACCNADAMPKAHFAISQIMGAINPIPRAHWVAECSELPADAATGIDVLAVVRRPRTVGILLRSGDQRGWLVGHRLGSREVGWWIYAVTGPAALRDRMAASPSCRLVKSWPEIWLLLPETAKEWLSERSTCCGEMVHGDRTYRSWPCIWETDRAPEVTVIARSGIGPGITQGGDGCALVGLGGE